jgi:hypothetical protein
VAATQAALSWWDPTWLPAGRLLWRGTVDTWADHCVAVPWVRVCGLAGSGRAHGIWWIGKGHHRVWSRVHKKTPMGSETTQGCSSDCPKGMAAQPHLAGGEVSQR